MNPVELYISTCRYVIQFNPNDQETWVDLYRFIPYLRQALTCCVCTKIFHCPMGPPETKCQHHVCKECIGGKMRIKPACGWCNDFDLFVDKPELRTLVMCYKKLCEYISSTAIMVELSALSNVGTSNGNQLLNLIQEASSIRDDDYDSFMKRDVQPGASSFDMLPPKLQKVEGFEPHIDNGSSNKPSTSSEVEPYSKDGVVVKTPKVNESEQSQTQSKKSFKKGSSRKRTNSKSEKVNSDCDLNDGINLASEVKLDNSIDLKRFNNVKEEETVATARKTSRKKGFKKGPVKQDLYDHEQHQLNMISKTVKAEHDYIKECPMEIVDKIMTKPRSRRTIGHNIQDKVVHIPIKKSKIETYHPQNHKKSNTNNITSKKLERFNKHKADHLVAAASKNNNNSSSYNVKSDKTSSDNVKSSSYNNNGCKSSRIYGCRCGLATPKPGNLTCCGQRCPCYSAYKGCMDCKCRGCRNPRGDPAKNPMTTLRLQCQLHQNLHIITTGNGGGSHGLENIDLSSFNTNTLLPLDGSCIEDEDLDIEIDI